METIRWVERDRDHEAEWHSESGAPVPSRVVVGDDTMTADTAMRLASHGTAILWRGDHHNARQLLKAMDRRIERRASRRQRDEVTFAGHRAERAQRATLMAHLVVELGADRSLDLRRAPDVREACLAAYGPGSRPMVVALSELLGVIGAHQWQTKGVHVPALGASIHPAYGVFSPVRGEYIDLVADAPLAQPIPRTAFDLGTGTGVLALVLAQRGVERVVATDINPRAVACARDNAHRLGVADRVEAIEADLFPDGRADLIVCNPPWLPGEPTSDLEVGIYDPGSTCCAASSPACPRTSSRAARAGWSSPTSPSASACAPARSCSGSSAMRDSRSSTGWRPCPATSGRATRRTPCTPPGVRRSPPSGG